MQNAKKVAVLKADNQFFCLFVKRKPSNPARIY
jgi:hypothetical protein